jgi:hypothetical protein
MKNATSSPSYLPSRVAAVIRASRRRSQANRARKEAMRDRARGVSRGDGGRGASREKNRRSPARGTPSEITTKSRACFERERVGKIRPDLLLQLSAP